MSAGRLFSAQNAWAALSPEQQREIGEAALLLDVATKALADAALAREIACRWDAAEQSAWLRLGAVGPDPDDYPGGPDPGEIKLPF